MFDIDVGAVLVSSFPSPSLACFMVWFGCVCRANSRGSSAHDVGVSEDIPHLLVVSCVGAFLSSFPVAHAHHSFLSCHSTPRLPLIHVCV